MPGDILRGSTLRHHALPHRLEFGANFGVRRPLLRSPPIGREVPQLIEGHHILRIMAVGQADVLRERAALASSLEAPLGEDDEIVCPPQHVAHLLERLGHWDQLDVLVIGYRGLDKGVLDLLAEGGRTIRSLSLVNVDQGAGDEAAAKFLERVKVVSAVGEEPVTVVPMGFTDFVGSGQLDAYIARIPGGGLGDAVPSEEAPNFMI